MFSPTATAELNTFLNVPRTSPPKERLARKSAHDDLSIPREPEIVSYDSRPKFPAYCEVRSMNISMASCDFSAWLAVFQSKLIPFSSA